MHRCRFAGFVVLALVAAVALPGSVSSAPGNGAAATGAGPEAIVTCTNFKTPKIDAIVIDPGNDQTTSPTFVDVPGMHLIVNIGGSATTCVKIQYSAFVFAGENRDMRVRATRDGVACNPVEVVFSEDGDEDGDGLGITSHAFNFLCTGVTPGARDFKIQWRSVTRGVISTFGRSMFVQHR